MRYVLVGAGSVGGVIAARLAQHSSIPPVLVARGPNGTAIRRNGLLLRSPDDESRIALPVAASASEAELGTEDVIVFATKSHQLLTALLEWVDRPVHDSVGAVAGTAGELLPVVIALNGIEGERLAIRFFRRVYGASVWLAGVHLTPGEFLVRTSPASGVFLLGRFGTPLDSDDASEDVGFLGALRADWEEATFRVHPTSDIASWKYRKLLSNVGNAVQALCGDDDSGGSGSYRALLDAARGEALDVYAAAGVHVPSDDEERDVLDRGGFRVRPIAGVETALGGSTWQSLQRGSGSVETDYLNGEIVRLARTVGVHAPVNETLQRLARQVAAAGRPPGSPRGTRPSRSCRCAAW